MKSITQDIKYYQAILSYADQHGVTKAAIKYRTYRQFIYCLRNRYDGTPESLAPKSRCPASPRSPWRCARRGGRAAPHCDRVLWLSITKASCFSTDG